MQQRESLSCHPIATYTQHRATVPQYPLLPEVLGMSAPEETSYQAGDCTVHHGYCAHGSINNTTDRDRVAYLWSYTPADARYHDGGTGNKGSLRLRAEDEREFPVIFRPEPLPKL